MQRALHLMQTTAAALLGGLSNGTCLREKGDILPPPVQGAPPSDCPRCYGKEAFCCYTDSSRRSANKQCCCTRNLAKQIEESLGRLREAQKHLGDSVAVAFNGGKDALAALLLWRMVTLESEPKKPLILVYFRTPNDFPELQKFIENTAQELEAELRVYEGDYKDQVAAACADLERDYPTQKSVTTCEWKDYSPTAFIIGFRAQDTTKPPQWREKSTVGPKFWRLHPLITWNYGDVWAFLRLLKSKHCELYDRGFTSIGKLDNTKPNPTLRNSDGSYKPAYMLTQWETERNSRDS